MWKELKIVDFHSFGFTKDKIVDLLHQMDKDFLPFLSTKVNFIKYSNKLFNESKIYVVIDEEARILGSLFFYIDVENRSAFIPVIWFHKRIRGLGYGRKIFNDCIAYLRRRKINRLSLETWNSNDYLSFYEKIGFKKIKRIKNRPNNIESVHLELSLNSIEAFPFTETITKKYGRISDVLGINLFVKHDDLFMQAGGGNKCRKLQYILFKANKEGCNAVVTTGSIHSNHVRATAIMCASLGWKTIMIIEDDKPVGSYRGNLKLIELTGSEIRFVKEHEVRSAMGKAINDLIKMGLKPYYVWGGGHSLEGEYAYYDAVIELKEQLADIVPDFIIVASGTGTTQAGLEIGVKQFYPECKVLGVSVARKAKKGKREIYDSMQELNDFLGKPVKLIDEKEIFFDDRMMGDGYGASWPELNQTIRWATETEGLFVDPIYSGKAFNALLNYLKTGIIKRDSNVVFWHTGSLINLLTYDES